jgi:hypothetical protein
MLDLHSPLNGNSLRTSSPHAQRSVRMSRWIFPLLVLILVTVMTILLSGCGSWLNDTRTGLLAANASINSYDDIAVEVWHDAASNPEAKKQLGISLCTTLIVQDNLIQAWAVTTAVDKGLQKEGDITPYLSTAITVLDSLEDYLEMGGVPIPEVVKVAIAYLESINPGGVLAPDAEPLEQCSNILAEKFPSAGLSSVPWETIISSGAELALFLMQIIQDSIQDKDVPEDALETYIRAILKQSTLYERSMTDTIGD